MLQVDHSYKFSELPFFVQANVLRKYFEPSHNHYGIKLDKSLSITYLGFDSGMYWFNIDNSTCFVTKHL